MVSKQWDNEQNFERETRRLLTEQVQALDEVILQRLAVARRRAVSTMAERRKSSTWAPLTAIAAGLVALMVWSGRPSMEIPDATLLESMDLLTADDSFEFYQDLEYFQWWEMEQFELIEELSGGQEQTMQGQENDT
jgi:hypothetical protein